MHLANHVDEASERREVYRASDKARHVPIAGTSAVSTSNEKLQVDLLFLYDLIASHLMAVFSKHFLLIPHAPQESARSAGRLPRCLDWGFWAARENLDK